MTSRVVLLPEFRTEDKFGSGQHTDSLKRETQVLWRGNDFERVERIRCDVPSAVFSL